MVLTWYEELIIVAIRKLLPFFSKYDFYISGLVANSRDGDYIEFFNCMNKTNITVIYNPGFDFIINKNKSAIFWKNNNIRISLKEKKNDFDEYINLPDNSKGPEELSVLLDQYLKFLEDKYSEYLV